eukprot:7110765-Heterocapsa_arctica.AAC.1
MAEVEKMLNWPCTEPMYSPCERLLDRIHSHISEASNGYYTSLEPTFEFLYPSNPLPWANDATESAA